MTGIVIIDFTDKDKEEKFYINFLALTKRCEFYATLNKNKSISDFLEYDQEKEKYLADKIISCENLMNVQETYWKKEHELLSMLKDSKKNFLSYVDEVEIMELTKEVAEYIKANKELHNKKIRVLKEYKLDEKTILNLKEQAKDINNIYFLFETISEYVDIEKADSYLKTKNTIVEQTNKYEYSQLEKMMYIYDKVKEYKCPDVFQLIIQELGFKSQNFVLSHMDKGLYLKHNRSLVHINDEKYNVNGAFFFDPKLELNESDKTYSNVNNYKFFAKNIEMMEYYDLYKKYIDITYFPALSEMKTEDIHNKYLTSAHAFARMPSEIGITINNLFNLFDKKPLKFPLNYNLNINKEAEENGNIAVQTKYYYTNIEGKKRTIKNKITKYINMLYKTIDSKTLMAILACVRETESKEDINRYKHDYEELIKASINSDWGINLKTKISKQGKKEMEVLFNWIDDNESEIDEIPVDNATILLENEKYACVENDECCEEVDVEEIETVEQDEFVETKQEQLEEIEEKTEETENNIEQEELASEEFYEIYEDFEEDIDITDEFDLNENIEINQEENLSDDESNDGKDTDLDDYKDDINVYIKNCLSDFLAVIDEELAEEDDEQDKK